MNRHEISSRIFAGVNSIEYNKGEMRLMNQALGIPVRILVSTSEYK